MQCPECGHNVTDGRTVCMYCGAVIGDASSGKKPDLVQKRQNTRFSRQVGKNGTVCEVIEEHEAYCRTDDVLEDWEKKIAEAIQRRGESMSGDPGFEEREILSLLSHAKTPRRTRLHPLILALIFFASAALAGIVLWLLR